MKRWIAIVGPVCLVGCGSAKSDFEKICNAEKLSGASSEPDPATKATKTATWINENIHSRDAKDWFKAIAATNMSPAEKGKSLKQAAHESGYDGPCPMADAN